MIAEIIAIGSELLTPFKQDTNSLFLTARLNELGVDVAFKSVVGDNQDHLVLAARTALNRADIIIFMGGLGPTEDDLTREAVAQAMRLKLRRDQDLVGELYARFAKFKWKMPENNLKQADVIYGAVALRNPNAVINLPHRDYWLAPERRPATFEFIRRQMMRFGTAMLVGSGLMVRTLMALPRLEDIFSQLAVEQDTAAISRALADLILQ